MPVSRGPVRFQLVPLVRLHHDSSSTGSVPLTVPLVPIHDRIEFEVPGWVPLSPACGSPRPLNPPTLGGGAKF